MAKAVRFIAFLWLTIAATRPAAADEARAPIRMFDGLPLVEVSVNDAAPRWFFVDTGSSVTTLSARFAAELGLEPAGDFAIETTSGHVAAALGTVSSVRVGTIELGGGEVVWHPLDRIGAPKDVDGVLGFDRLGRFNFLLDYRTRTLSVDPDEARIGHLGGERVTFARSMGRPVVEAVVQVRNDPERLRRLVVDSGATTTVLLDSRRSGRDGTRLSTLAGTALARSVAVSVRVGSRTLTHTSAVILESLPATTREDQGLLPASLFAWMYFDVSRGEIVWQRA